MTNHYDEITINDITVSGVIQLTGYLHDPESNSKGEEFERYYYAKGYGLIGWEDPSKGWLSFLESNTYGTNAALDRYEYPWLTLKEDASTPRLIYPTLVRSAFPSAGTNVRESASTDSAVIAIIKSDIEVETALDIATENFVSDSSKWYSIRFSSGIVGWVRSDVVVFAQIVEDTGNTQELCISYDANNTEQIRIIEVIESIVELTGLLDIRIRPSN